MVNDRSPSAESNGAARRYPAANDAAAQLRALADLSASLCDGAACLIAWQGVGKATTIRAATDSRSESLLDALFAAVERDPRYHANRRAGRLRLGHRELSAACGPRAHAIDAAAVSLSYTAGAGAEAAMHATVILTAPRAPHSHDLVAAAELAATAAIAIIRATAADASRDFWRTRTSESAERLARSRSESSGASSERSRIDRAAAAAEKLRSRNRFASLGALFAKLGPFDAWIIATTENGVLRVCAVSGVFAPAG
jgi:hypothetical protein